MHVEYCQSPGWDWKEGKGEVGIGGREDDKKKDKINYIQTAYKDNIPAGSYHHIDDSESERGREREREIW